MIAHALSAALRQPARAWGSYIQQLDRNPVATKVATSFVSAALGDALAQRLTARPDGAQRRYDWRRSAQLCVFNGLMGWLGHFYYAALDARVMIHAPKSAAAVVVKVIIDQLMFAPVCTAVFYAYKCAVEARPRHLGAELRAKWLPTLKAGWMLWPAAHALNFALVPTQHRILYINVVSVAGTYVLSRAAAGDFSGKKTREHSPSPTEVVFDGVSVKLE